MQGRRGAQGEIGVEAHFAEHTDTEARTVGIHIGIPLFAAALVNGTGILQFHVLKMKAQQKSVVKAALVQIGTVLYLAGLGLAAKSCQQQTKSQ